MRAEFTWRLREHELKLGERTLVMGVVNVTPDSFSEAGLHFSPPAAVEHGLRQLEEGADILDVGGESTRPGAKVVDTEAVAGGGSLPGLTIPSCGIAVEVPDADAALTALRSVGVVARVEAGAVVCDLRTIDPSDDPRLAAALATVTTAP